MQKEQDDMTQITFREFAERLASKEPTPGGGGAAAMCGVLGIALGSMVINLTVGKKKYAPVEEEMQELLKESGMLQEKMCDLINEDAVSFLPLAKAYSLPRNTPGQQAHRTEVLEEAMVQACKVPLEIMRTCGAAIDIIEKVAYKGSTMALSDAGAGTQMCMCAMEAASLNIYINAASMMNREAAGKLTEEADELIAEYRQSACRVEAYVMERLRNGG